jgi:hypothetical protein
MLIKLSTVIAAYIVLATCAFASSNPLIIYKCTYQIERPNKPVFIMSGNIIANDATESSNEYETTYLTLAPNEMSGINVEARILILKGGHCRKFRNKYRGWRAQRRRSNYFL